MKLPPSHPPHTVHTDFFANTLGLLAILRVVALIGFGVVSAISIVFLKLTLPIFPLSLIAGSYAFWTLCSFLRMHYMALPVTALEMTGQLLVDVAVLTGLIYWTGGVANPFIALFLLQVIVATSLLPFRHSVVVVLTTCCAYGYLLLYHADVPGLHHGHDNTLFDVHMYGMLACFLLSACVILWMMYRFRHAISLRDHLLTEARTQNVHDTYIVKLGAVAAGAAHALGTPLNTMTLVIAEMERMEMQEAMRPELATLKEQVIRCKNVLGELAGASGALRMEGGSGIYFDRYVDDLAFECKRLHPHLHFAVRYEGELPAPRVVREQVMQQAVQHMLKNAAEAARTCVDITLTTSETECICVIEDDGEGIALEIRERLGEPFVTSKASGQGIGVFLTKAVIERLGGKVLIDAKSTKTPGTRVTLIMPRAALEVV